MTQSYQNVNHILAEPVSFDLELGIIDMIGSVIFLFSIFQSQRHLEERFVSFFSLGLEICICLSSRFLPPFNKDKGSESTPLDLAQSTFLEAFPHLS